MLTNTEQIILNAINVEYNDYREDELLSLPINFYAQGIITGIKTCVKRLEANVSEEFLKELKGIKEMLYENLEEDMRRCGL